MNKFTLFRAIAVVANQSAWSRWHAIKKSQNSSKSHLFQKLKNTLISRWHY